MNLSDGKLVIEAGDDPAIRTAVVAKILLEAVTALVSVALLVNVHKPDLFPYWIDKAKAKVRFFFLGPPPLTEEQIKQIAGQVVIEAMRVVRYES